MTAFGYSQAMPGGDLIWSDTDSNGPGSAERNRAHCEAVRAILQDLGASDVTCANLTDAIADGGDDLTFLNTSATLARNSKGSGGGTAAAIIGVLLLLLAVVAGAAVWHRKRQQQAEQQHGQGGAVRNPAYIVDVDAANPRRNSVVATDSNQRQFFIPMEADNAGAGDGDGAAGAGAGAGSSAPTSGEYLVPVAYNAEYEYAPPMPPPTPRHGIPANAAAAANGTNASAVLAKDADGYVVDDYAAHDGDGFATDDHVEEDADGYVVDGFVGGNPIVYATAAEHGAGNGGAVYSVAASEGDAIEVHAPAAAGIESNA
eukprot:gene14592-19645_t